MLRITLVQPPSNYEETFLLSPPLGLLSIAAAAESEGAVVNLLDFNLKGLQDKKWQIAEHFYPHAVELIQQQNPDVVGFTSMAIESHVCLETARLLKKENPNIITVFGGPHFGAIATEALEHYDWVDYVISGEGEAPLQNLIRHLEGNNPVATMDNIAHREGNAIIFNRHSMSGRDLDEIPFPAYHLVDMEEYHTLNPSRLVCFEHARGCFLKCSFCYSPQHWGHGESRKSIARILAELKQLEKMGIKELFWISDNLLNSKTNAISICDAIRESELKFKWHCYSTMPQITEPVVKALSGAGCQSIFVGVDAVAEDTKKKYKKSYFKGWDGLREKLSLCLKNGITPTCAFMLSPYDKHDTRESTLRIAALCANLGCFVRLNALTYYNQTEIASRIDLEIDKEYSEAYAIVLFDTAEILIRNDYAQLMPELFPFHRCFTKKSEHDSFAGYCRTAMQVINNHCTLVAIGILEHDLTVRSLIEQLNDRFELNQISCRGLENIWTRINLLVLFHKFCRNFGIPSDLISVDFYGQKSILKNKIVLFKVDDCDVTCILPEVRFLNSKLRLENPGLVLESDSNNYLIRKTGSGMKAIKISDSAKELLNCDESRDNFSLPFIDYVHLVKNDVLLPAL